MKIFGISSINFGERTEKRTPLSGGAASVAIYDDGKLVEKKHENPDGRVEFKTLYNSNGVSSSTIEYEYKPNGSVVASQYKSSLMPMNVVVTKPSGASIRYEYDMVLGKKNLEDKTRHDNYGGIETATYYDKNGRMTMQKEYRKDYKRVKIEGIEQKTPVYSVGKINVEKVPQSTTGSLYKTMYYQEDGRVITQKFDDKGNPAQGRLDYVA